MGLIYNSWLCGGQILFFVPIEAVKSSPQAPETHSHLAMPAQHSTNTSLSDSCSGFQLLLCFYPWGVPLLSHKLSHASKRIFVIF